MIKLIKLALGWATGQTEWLVLLAVAGIAAYFYADGRAVRADRAEIVQAARLICAGADAEFLPTTTLERSTKGKPVKVDHARGVVCQRQVGNLARFERLTNAATAETLAKAMRDHDTKSGTDAARAAQDAKAARAATERMEKADAEIDQSNRVGGSWFDAVNDVGGLRPARR